MYHSRLMSTLAMAALAAILVPPALTAQITFQRTYGGTANEDGRSVQQTTDGGYIIAGWTDSYGAGGDLYLIKTNANGDTVLTRTFGGVGIDIASAVQQTADGGYIIAGWTTSFGAGDPDVYLIKTDAAGDTLWTRTYGGSMEDYGFSVLQTADSGYIIAGQTNSFGAGATDFYLVKTNATGDTLWSRTYGGAGDDWGNSVQQEADGGYIIAGYTSSFGAGDADVCLIKTDANGDTLWSRTYGGTYEDWGASVQQTTDGGYIIAGDATDSGGDNYNVYLIKTGANGDTLWTRTFGGAYGDLGYSVQQTADSGYVIVGYTESFGAGNRDVYLIKTDASGDTLWTRSFGGSDQDFGNSVQQTNDGGYIITGGTDSYGAGNNDVYLLKTDSLGNVAVAETKASPTRTRAFSLSCEPNPSRGSVIISLSPSIPLSLSPILRIYDSQGRMVLSRPVSTSSFPISTSDLPSGTYFIRLAAAGHLATQRLILQH
ncbi:MAG: T9SS type A sorting domain-containing protein [candidate division WOR-3 bacterium]|nr:T9SS type A sorting domain-containing protein [candidate division WOR-3 bacterium]